MDEAQSPGKNLQSPAQDLPQPPHPAHRAATVRMAAREAANQRDEYCHAGGSGHEILHAEAEHLPAAAVANRRMPLRAACLLFFYLLAQH
jgi:hypothetical protein